MPLCECGCGQTPNTAKWDRPARGVKKGEHFRFVSGHHQHGWPKGRGKRPGKPLTQEHKENISKALSLAFKEGRAVAHYTPRKTPIIYTEAMRRVLSENAKRLWQDPKYRERMSNNHKGLLAGEKHPMFGKPRTEETKRKISEAKKGKHFSEEIRSRMNKGKTGVPLSEEHRRRISEGNKGKIRTEETKQKLSELNTGKSPSAETRKKLGDALRGKTRPPEVCRKISIAKKGKHVSVASEFTKARYLDPEFIKKMSKAWTRKPNKPETLLMELLNRLYPGAWKYTGDFSIAFGGKNPDFMTVGRQKKILELFGDWWHRGQDPEERIAIFRSFGFDTLVVWERELKDMDSVVVRIHAFMEA